MDREWRAPRGHAASAGEGASMIRKGVQRLSEKIMLNRKNV
jgi:hypothetical protein